MKVLIKSLLKGAKQARGCVVIIDVFRTSSLITTLIAKNVKHIVPVLKPQQARILKENNENFILIGERMGRKLSDFNYNISPTELSKANIKNKTIILSTTNGTRGILNVKNADEILIGCFLNAKHLANYLMKKQSVTLVPIGFLYGKLKAIEDEVCAKVIRDYMLNNKVDPLKISHQIKHNLTTYIRDRVQNQDIDFCVTMNKYKIIPQFIDGRIIAK